MIVMTNIIVVSGVLLLVYLLSPSVWRGAKRCVAFFCCRRGDKGEWRIGIVDLLFPRVGSNQEPAKPEIELQNNEDGITEASNPNLADSSSATEQPPAKIETRNQAYGATDEDRDDDDTAEEPSNRLTEWGEAFTPRSYHNVMM